MRMRISSGLRSMLKKKADQASVRAYQTRCDASRGSSPTFAGILAFLVKKSLFSVECDVRTARGKEKGQKVTGRGHLAGELKG